MSNQSSLSSLKTYAIPLAAVVVVGVCLPLIVMPGYGDIQKNLEAKSSRETASQALDSKISSLSVVDHESNLALLSSVLEPAVPAGMDAAGLLGQLERTARNVGLSTAGTVYNYEQVELTDEAPSVLEEGPVLTEVVMPLQRVSTSFTLTGRFDALIDFIKATESALRLTSINTIHISVDDPTDPDTLTAAIDIEAPFILDLDNLGPAGSPLPTAVDDAVSLAFIDRLKGFSTEATSEIDIDSIKGRTNPF